MNEGGNFHSESAALKWLVREQVGNCSDLPRSRKRETIKFCAEEVSPAWAAKGLPARRDVTATAKLRSFVEHDIQILMAVGKLTPLGNPARMRRNGLPPSR